MDFWALRCLEEMREAEEAGMQPGAHTGDQEMADTIMDFLFASQDKSKFYPMPDDKTIETTNYKFWKAM